MCFSPEPLSPHREKVHVKGLCWGSWQLGATRHPRLFFVSCLSWRSAPGSCCTLWPSVSGWRCCWPCSRPGPCCCWHTTVSTRPWRWRRKVRISKVRNELRVTRTPLNVFLLCSRNSRADICFSRTYKISESVITKATYYNVKDILFLVLQNHHDNNKKICNDYIGTTILVKLGKS